MAAFLLAPLVSMGEQGAEVSPSLTLKGSPTAEQAEAFARTRANVLSLPRTLPNIICQQSTDRFVASNDEPDQSPPATSTPGNPSHALYGTPSAPGGGRKQTATVTYANQTYAVSEFRPPRDVKWKYRDTITADVAYVDGQDTYSSIALNGRVTGAKDMEVFLGLTSAGEFGADLISLLSPEQAKTTEFSFRGTETLFNRPVLVFDFRVQQGGNVQWHWYVQTVRLFHKGPKIHSWPGYAGSLWIDAARHEVLRMEIRAVEIEPKFPARVLQQTVDYGHVQAGHLRDLFVPIRSETITCDRTYPACDRNVLEFKNWREFVVTSIISPTSR